MRGRLKMMVHVERSMDENFSGSCIVTSRNPLIHNGATTATTAEFSVIDPLSHDA
jgi:hypothetical protein